MSNFVVSARKYRPQRFEDVVGQQHVALTLKNALGTSQVAHAFLFTGPRGVGKTTCARILAKVLNCENRTPDHEACGECAACKSFSENASFNIIELDAASNNSVEHIRALTEQVRFQPQQGRYKVFIIDEVHMLSQAAFNAFLKTLEEPPPYAIFILATTEKHKIIPTILSRCQIFDFRRITVGDMVLHLKSICKQEGITAEEDALHIIAQKADGALRDALSIFDRIASASPNRQIRYDDVIEQLNVLDYDYYFQVTDALLAEDQAGLMLLFDQILRKGFEPDLFINGLAEHLRNILVCKDEATLSLLETGDNLRERYRRQAALAPASFLLTALHLANDCDINYKMARAKRLHVEMYLIRMCYVSRLVQEKKTVDGIRVEGRGLKVEGGGLKAEGNGAKPARTNPPEVLLNPSTLAPQPSNVNGNAHLLGVSEVADLKAGVKQGLKKVESIPLKLEAYEAAVLVEEAEHATRQSLLTPENAEKEWKAYAAKAGSQFLRQAMQDAELVLTEKTLVAKVSSSVFREYIQQEVGRLNEHLRSRLHDRLVKVQAELDEARTGNFKAAAAPARPLTKAEKLEKMKTVNPLVSELIQRLDLKLED